MNVQSVRSELRLSSNMSDLKLFTTQSGLLTPLRKRPFESIVGKGENAGNQHFSLSYISALSKR